MCIYRIEIMTLPMVCSSCKKHYDSVYNETPKIIIKHVMIVEGGNVVEKNNNHPQHQIMNIIYPQSQAHNHHSHNLSIH